MEYLGSQIRLKKFERYSEMYIRQLDGKTVYHKKILSKGTEQLINLPSLKAGMYMVNFVSGNEKKIAKILFH